MEEDRTGETEPVLFLPGRMKMALKSYQLRFLPSHLFSCPSLIWTSPTDYP